MSYLLDNKLLKNIFNKEKINNDNNLKFLYLLNDYVDTEIIYNVLKSIDIQTNKNIINYIFLKWCKINKISYDNNIKSLDINEFDTKLTEFINDELYKAIYVYNSIIVYLTQ